MEFDFFSYGRFVFTESSSDSLFGRTIFDSSFYDLSI
jgi:hypothetical protein